MKIYSNATVQKYFEQGLCLRCGKCKPDENSKSCFDCKKKHRDLQEKFKNICPDKIKEWRNKSNRNRKNKYEINGMCITCGKFEPKEGLKRCDACLKYMSEHNCKYARNNKEKRS